MQTSTSTLTPMNPTFKRTKKQIEQTAVLASGAKHCMSYGGSRSGKTFGICRALIIRACKTPSRHLATRLRFNHAKTSLWHETFPKVFELCFPDFDFYKMRNKTDYYIEFPNGSEIWIAGLDDKERTEKILGKEYSTIYFNECSQIPYSTVSMALTRLAERNLLRKKAWYDQNPPTKRHWSYSVFELGRDPDTWEPLKTEQYKSILMNPSDNIQNIDPEYIDDILANLPERERQRFLYGTFQDDSEGAIYHAFDRESHVIATDDTHRGRLMVGLDFNVDPMTAVLAYVGARKIHVFGEVFLRNSNTFEMADYLTQNYGRGLPIVPDATGRALKTSAAGQSDHDILRKAGHKILGSNNPFRMDRYNAVNRMFETGDLTIDPSCVNLIKDLDQMVFKEGTSLPDTSNKLAGHSTDSLGYLVNYCFPIQKPTIGIRSIPR